LICDQVDYCSENSDLDGNFYGFGRYFEFEFEFNFEFNFEFEFDYYFDCYFDYMFYLSSFSY